MIKEKAYMTPQKTPCLSHQHLLLLEKSQERIRPRLEIEPGKWCFQDFYQHHISDASKLAFLMPFCSMQVLLFPFHSWGAGTQTELTTCPKSLRQSTKERERKKTTNVSESLVKILINGLFLLAGEMSWRRRLVAPAQPPQAELGFRVRKQANVWLSIWRVFALIKLLSLES